MADMHEACRSALADCCVEAEDVCRRLGLRSITQFTLIARDPANDEMSIVTTNERDLTDDVLRVLAKLKDRDTVRDPAPTPAPPEAREERSGEERRVGYGRRRGRTGRYNERRAPRSELRADRNILEHSAGRRNRP